MAHAGWDGAGGTQGLVGLLREFGGPIDADLQRFYSLSLNDWAAGRVSTRRLISLIAELPSEGTAYHRAVIRAMPEGGARQEPPEEWWTPERHFLATLINLFRGYMWAKSDPQKRGALPEPLGPPSSKRATAPRDEVPYAVAIAALDAVAPTRTIE